MVSVGRLQFSFVSLLVLAAFVAFAQEAPPATNYLPNQRVHIVDLPTLKAQPPDRIGVLQTSVETILHDQDLCCGKDSALGDAVLAADPKSLQDVAVKLQGRHLLGDGRPIQVIAEFVPAASINSGVVIQSLGDKHAMLLQWNSRIYVLHGTVFDETADYNGGGVIYAIRKLELWDLRYSDERRKVSFNRETDDLGELEGMLVLTVSGP